MTKEEKIQQFDPSGIGLKNEHFIGLPFDENDAELVLLPVPWDVTVSYKSGTSGGPANILEASAQLDLYDPEVPEAWKMGLFMRPVDQTIIAKNEHFRAMASGVIQWLENDQAPEQSEPMLHQQFLVNQACQEIFNWVKEKSKILLDKNKLVALVGGEHSTPLGLIHALSERHESFGILQLDAHMDLRRAYEGFTYSHASIFYNALKLENISTLVQVGIRDYCEEEINRVVESEGRIKVFYDHQIKEQQYSGKRFDAICRTIIGALPDKIYVSFDIDGLQPFLCPNTGTPVPGGLLFEEAIYLLNLAVREGKQIIGFDVCEVAGSPFEWDGSVGARIIYKLANLAGKSNNRI